MINIASGFVNKITSSNRSFFKKGVVKASVLSLTTLTVLGSGCQTPNSIALNPTVKTKIDDWIPPITVSYPNPDVLLNGKFVSQQTVEEIKEVVEECLKNTTNFDSKLVQINIVIRTDETAAGLAYDDQIKVILDPSSDGNVNIDYIRDIILHELGHFDERLLSDADFLSFCKAGKWIYDGHDPVRVYDNLNWTVPSLKRNRTLSNDLISYTYNSNIDNTLKNKIMNMINENQVNINSGLFKKDGITAKILSLFPKENQQAVLTIINVCPVAFRNPFERYAEFYKLWRLDSENFVITALAKWGDMNENPYLIDELKTFINLTFKRTVDNTNQYELFTKDQKILINENILSLKFNDFTKDFIKSYTIDDYIKWLENPVRISWGIDGILQYAMKGTFNIDAMKSLISLLENSPMKMKYAKKILLLMDLYTNKGIMDENIFKIMIELLNISDKSIKQRALILLWIYANKEFANQKAFDKVVELLSDSNKSVIQCALILLSTYADKGFVNQKVFDKAIELLSDSDKSVIQNTLFLISRFAVKGFVNQKVFDKAIELLSDSDKSVIDGTMKLLWVYSNKGFVNQKVFDKAIELLSDSDKGVIQSTLRLLSRYTDKGITNKKIIAPLKILLEYEDETIKANAKELLDKHATMEIK